MLTTPVPTASGLVSSVLPVDGLSAGLVTDVVVVVLALLSVLSGFRRGLVLGVLSLVGFLGAGALAASLLPEALAGWEPPWQRTVLVVGGVLVAALLGQALLVALGVRLRALVPWTPLRVLDGLLGALLSLAVLAVLVWFAAGALRAAPVPVLTRAVEGSAVVAVVEDAAPLDPRGVFDELGSALGADGFPRVFADGREAIAPASPPDEEASTAVQAVARQVRGSVVKVTGVAQACRRGVEGTGFVVEPGRVVTNAHVVAGVDAPTVQVAGEGPPLDATVVLYDPERDLAVLAVPDLAAPPLALGDALAAGDAAAVVGFPLDGPYDVEAATVRQVVRALGEDVYGEPGVVREVYALRTAVEPGNSGGPLVDTDGDVVGVVFARSVDDAGTGYALTLEESSPVLEAAATAVGPADTRGCTGT